MAPERIGKYEIKRLLGEGATGSVYVASDPFYQQDVALKVMKTLPADPDQARRQLRFFQNEAALAGKLRHPHIVTILDAGIDNEVHYLAMELVEGEPLTRYCESGALLDLARILGVVYKASKALEYANRAGVVLVPFDNVLDSEEIIQVNEDQLEMGRIMGRWLTKTVGDSGKIIEVRGLQGNSVDRDRHLGFREVMEADGNDFEIIEVVGNWDDGTAQKVVADAVAVHKKFDGMFVQGGSTGAVRALIDAKHPMIPVAGEAENGFRKLCAARAKDGLLCTSLGQSPGLVAISMKAAVAALQGKVMPQMISVPIPTATHPNFKAGENYFPDLTDNFFTTNDFPACGVNLKATDIMSKDEKNN